MKKKDKKEKKRLHKAVILLTFILIISSFSVVDCFAREDKDDKIGMDVDSILNDFSAILPESGPHISDASSLSEAVGIKRILSDVIDAIKGESGNFADFLLTLLGISLIMALVSQWEGEMSGASCRAIGIIFSVMMLERFTFIAEGMCDSLSEINGFFASVIPISIAVNSFGVSPTTASVQAFGMGITLGIYSFICSRFLSGLAIAIFVLSSASAIHPLFTRFSRGARNVFLSILGILTVLIGATFALQTTIASSSDSAILRGAKYAVSSAVPVVGSAVSGTLGVLGGAVTYARGIVGGGAVAVIISLMLSPLVTVLLYRVCLKIGISLASLCSIDGAESAFSSFLGALDILIGVYSLTSVLYIVELVAFMKGGGAFA